MKYQITDNQSGKTLVISGDSPPTDQEAEQLFQQSGVRSANTNQISQPPQQTNALSNPTLGGILGNMGNAIKDTATGLINMKPLSNQQSLQNSLLSSINPLLGAYSMNQMHQPTRQQATQDSSLNQANSLMDMAQKTSDPTQKMKLIKTAQEMSQQVSQNAQQTQAQYSPSIEQNPLARGLRGGAEVGLTADALLGALGLVKGGVSLTKNAIGAQSINPWKIAGYAKDVAENATPEIEKTALNPIIEAGDKAAKVNPDAAGYWESLRNNIPTDTKDLGKAISDWGHQTWTNNGSQRVADIASLRKALYGAGRQVIENQAPDVAKQTANFSLLHNIPKMVKQGSWTALKMTALGKMLGL